MNVLSVLLLSFTIAVIPSFGGTVQQLPALPNGATAQALQLDGAGNIYVAGSLPPKSPKSASDTTDAFVAKLSPDGSKVVYFTVLAGSAADAATALAVGSDDSVYVTGTTSSTDFPVTKGAFETVSSAITQQAFAAKLNASGAVQYATYLGGIVETAGVGIAIDNAGDAFVLGNGAPPAIPQIAGGSTNLGGFVIKLDPIGSKALASFTGLGGSYIAVDGQGSMYIAGSSFAAPPFTPGTFQTTEAGRFCGGAGFFVFPCGYQYVAKIDPTGTQLIYWTGLNGTFGATPSGLAVDAGGNTIIAGTTNSPDFPVTADAFESIYAPVIPSVITYIGPSYPIIPPPSTGFAAKLNATGSALIWSTFFGGSTTDRITSMSVDPDGGIVIAGQAGSTDLPGIEDTPAGCLPSPIQEPSFAARLAPDASSASPSQLLYGAVTYSYGTQAASPIAVASPAFGAVIAVETSGALAAANLYTPSRLACATDPADNVQLTSVAPGQDLSLFGSSLAPMLELVLGETPMLPNGVDAVFDGNTARILYASPSQVNMQVPPAINGQSTVQMKLTNAETTGPLDEMRTFAVVPSQPSVFLTFAALTGATPACVGNVGGFQPEALAINADGSINSAANPAAAGSKVTIFLNGAPQGSAVTGMINASAGTFTATGFNEGVLAVSFQVPASDANGVNLMNLQAGGAAVRETNVTVCVTPASSN